jgi:HlyD family secretion protein
MPADVQIRTDDRTVLSYLLKPIEDQVSKAFRER